MSIQVAYDFPTYNLISNATIPKVFNPEMYGFQGTWPIGEWNERSAQHYDYYQMASGRILDATDKMSKNRIYPVKTNVWDFISSVHAFMSMGEDKDQAPRLSFIGDGSWDKTRAQRYNQFVSKAWYASGIDLFSLFWNINVYGAHAIVVRYDLNRRFPIFFEPIPATDFFPVLDSAGRVLEYFIHREISHSEAKWRYGVTIDASAVPYYVEHWDPMSYEVRINGGPAYSSNGERKVISGRNIFGIAPAVYVPHMRKQDKYGDSQLKDTKEQGLEFNARIADVSDGVRGQMTTAYVGHNIKTPRAIKVGNQVIYNIGDAMDLRDNPEITPLTNSVSIKDSSDFVESLWSMLTTFAYIPPIALGVDEGSQRSSLTLRTRFWLLNSHCGVERHNMSEQIIRLGHMTIIGLRQMGYPDVTTDGLSLEASIEWPEMLPEDRAELLNEMIQRFGAGIISRQRAIREFGDVEDVEAEEALIDADIARKQKEALALAMGAAKAQAAARPAPSGSGGKSKSNQSGGK